MLIACLVFIFEVGNSSETFTVPDGLHINTLLTY